MECRCFIKTAIQDVIPPWSLHRTCHLSASTRGLVSCVVMFYSASGRIAEPSRLQPGQMIQVGLPVFDRRPLDPPPPRPSRGPPPQIDDDRMPQIYHPLFRCSSRTVLVHTVFWGGFAEARLVVTGPVLDLKKNVSERMSLTPQSPE